MVQFTKGSHLVSRRSNLLQPQQGDTA